MSPSSNGSSGHHRHGHGHDHGHGSHRHSSQTPAEAETPSRTQGHRHGRSSAGSSGSPRTHRHGHGATRRLPEQLTAASSETSSLAEASFAAATAAAEAAEAIDGACGEHGEYYGGEYYGDYANNNYYYNYYYGSSTNLPGLSNGEASHQDENNEEADGHARRAPLTPERSVATTGDVEDVEDADSGSYRASVTSSVRAHTYESGLRYHAFQGSGGAGDTLTATRSGKLYALPNDEMEQNRDDMKHALTLLMMHGQPFYAPVHTRLEAGGEVYDLGTGTGIWAIEIADKYPNATVRGVDLSPIQPNYVPNNVFFAVDDFEDKWVYPHNVFDYVHMRHSLFAVDDRPALLRQIFRHLKPGGYVEFQELLPVPLSDDGSLGPTTPYALRDFFRYIGAGMQQSPVLAGGDLLGSHHRSAPNLTDTLTTELQAAGFRGIHANLHKCPLGVWPRDRRLRGCGALTRTALMDGLRGWAFRPLGTTAGGLGWSSTQIEVFLVDVRKALMDASVHVYFPLHVVYAQKPL